MSLGGGRKTVLQRPGLEQNESRRGGSVFELALLVLKDGDGIAERFESAFSEAEPLLRNAPGYRSHCLTKCLEAACHYALVVEWKTLAHHVEGFRESAAYPRWKALLEAYVRPDAWVRHFKPVPIDGARQDSRRAS